VSAFTEGASQLVGDSSLADSALKEVRLDPV